MDPETALFVASAALAAFWSTLIGILHVRGWLPAAYTARLRDIQSETASKVGEAVKDALRAVASEQRAEYEAAAAEVAKEAGSVVRRAEGSIFRGAQTDKNLNRQADAMIGQAILAGGKGILLALRQIAPGFADQIETMLEENPEGAMQLWELIQSRPSFRKYVAPRLNALMAGTEAAPTDTGNPFLGELGR